MDVRGLTRLAPTRKEYVLTEPAFSCHPPVASPVNQVRPQTPDELRDPRRLPAALGGAGRGAGPGAEIPVAFGILSS
jgi:hypothetical protein